MRSNIFNMAYIDSTSELTLLLIHGFPLSSMMWWPQINGLASFARVIAPDLRGFGQSESPHSEMTMQLYAEDCLALLDNLQISDPVVLCGMSMGGYIAFEFWRRFPQRVAGLILTSTRAEGDSAETQAGRAKTIEQLNKEGVTPIAQMMLPRLMSDYHATTNPLLSKTLEEIMSQASVEGAVGATQAMKNRADSRPTLATITVPTLVIHGTDDKIVPLTEAQEMSKAIPKAVFSSIARAGHIPNLEEPERWNGIAADFLQNWL